MVLEVLSNLSDSLIKEAMGGGMQPHQLAVLELDGESVFFRGFFWKPFLVKQKPEQKDTDPDKFPYLHVVLNYTSLQVFFDFPCTWVNFGKQMLYKMELPNLSKAGISRREKTGHGSSLWLKNRAAGCQHPFQHQKCFISI